jgi:hypothetical protein
LPPVSPLWLSAFGLALAALLGAIVLYSVRLSERSQHVETGAPHGAPQHGDSHSERKHGEAGPENESHGKHE